MLNSQRIHDGAGRNGHYLLFSTDDVELVNPLEYFKELFIAQHVVFERNLIATVNPFIERLMRDEVFVERAEQFWEKEFSKMTSKKIPHAFTRLFGTESKGEQEKILKGASIDREEWLAFICYAWKEEGYRYSNYISEYPCKTWLNRRRPKLIHLDDNDRIVKVGESDLSEGDLKNAIYHRRVTVSSFFDNGETWHCFFFTYRSLQGRESWNGGQAHMHYLSDKFGMSREHILKRLKSPKHPASSIHISLLNFGNQVT